jgi:hypothetical protein
MQQMKLQKHNYPKKKLSLHKHNKKKDYYSRRARSSRIRCIVEKNRIDNMDDTVIDKNVWTNDFRAQAVGSNKGSRRVGDELNRFASCRGNVSR